MSTLERQGLKYSSRGTNEFQPGSRNRVLKNLPGIVRVRELEDAELQGYMRAEGSLLTEFGPDHSFTVEDLNLIHRRFLGEIYPWAGTFRTVNLSKGGFPFASAYAIPQAMLEFGKDVLRTNTPCTGQDTPQIAEQIAVVHAELLLIHPYREGNGRTARLLATFMAYQAGRPGIDFGFIGNRGKQFDRYVAAIQAGVLRNFGPMIDIVVEGLKRGGRLTAEPRGLR